MQKHSDTLYAQLSEAGKIQAKDWLRDPCYDLGDSPDLAPEDNSLLGRWQGCYEAERQLEREENEQARAEELGITLEAVRELESAERSAQCRRERAVYILRQLIPTCEPQGDAELLVDALILAAITEMRIELLKEGKLS